MPSISERYDLNSPLKKAGKRNYPPGMALTKIPHPTILIVEQYLDFVWRFADRYCAMQGGRIVREGDVATESVRDVAHLVQI